MTSFPTRTRMSWLVRWLALLALPFFVMAGDYFPHPDAPKTRKAFEAAFAQAKRGDAQAQYIMCAAYDRPYKPGRFVESDPIKALYWCTRAAEQGVVNAQFMLGRYHYYGESYVVKRDDAKALHWLQLAADHGHSGGQAYLGKMHTTGRGVPKNDEKAIYWYTLALKQGNFVAVQGLQELRERYGDFAQNLALAKQGDLEAMWNAGRACLMGSIQSPECTHALDWCTHAAQQGLVRAQLGLGKYYLGDDNEKALYWLELAANQGDVNAQYTLGEVFRSGSGNKKDLIKAAHWYEMAARKGHSPAQTELDKIRRH